MQNDGAAGTAPTRAELIAQAVEQWSGDVSALGGRDPLLSYRDLKVGTLDLAAAEPMARKLLLEGEPVLISKLFPYEPLRSSALRSVRAIRDKTRELAEERGLQACFLAVGIATWANPFAARRPTAPVMLRSASVVARDPAETDFVIAIADDPFVNPVLLHALDAQLGLRFDADDLRDPAGRMRYATVVERLRDFAPPHVVDGFSIAHRAVLATFTSAPLALARDLTAFGVDLQQHDIVAALAGDSHASSVVARPAPPVPAEYQVLDTSAEQDAVVEAVAGAGHLRVQAPPGTGRTQTVAALVAELTGRGQRVLVVGEKRATLDDLVARLASAGLRDIVLDAGRTPPDDAVQQIAETARRLARMTPAEDRPSGDPRAAALAAELDAYREAVHRVRQPWGSTAYDAMVLVAAAPEHARTAARIDPDALAGAGSGPAGLRAKLREYADLEGLTLGEGDSPWYGSDVRSEQAAESMMETVTDLRERALPSLRDAATRAAVEVGLNAPTSVAECVAIVDLLASVAENVDTFGRQIWDEPLDDLAAATGDRAFRSVNSSAIGFFARRKLRGRLAELMGTSGRLQRQQAHQGVLAAREQLTTWRGRSRDGKAPRTGPHLPDAIEATEAVKQDLAALAATNPRTSGLEDLPFSAVAKRLDELIDDERHLRSLPRLYELQADLSAAGLDDLVADLRRRDIDADRVEAVFDYAWHSSLLDLWRNSDLALGRFERPDHERRLDEFWASDIAEVQGGAQQVLHDRHVRFSVVAEECEGQTAVLTESTGSSLPPTPRELVEEAPDVALAAVPCWIVSPLAVSEVLPARRLFDVVIVEDAGRVAVAEAVASIARGQRLVLIGDDEVTRSPFTTAVEPAPDPDAHEGPWGQTPPASLADMFRDVLPERSLSGQYRVRDDRLVTFAARSTYAGRLTTVPGVGGNERLTMDIVDAPPVAEDPVDSASAEVARVVELILDHVRTRPHESLGVVTLGPRHAERLDAAVRQALIHNPEVAGYLHGDRSEPFFVKDVEQVAGDVRDAVILSLGYGRSADGRILYRFGALGRPGGERRLTAATTCARERLTVVATFGARDLSPRRLTTPGAQALGAFLAYVQENTEPGDTVVSGEISTARPVPVALAQTTSVQAAGVEDSGENERPDTERSDDETADVEASGAETSVDESREVTMSDVEQPGSEPSEDRAPEVEQPEDDIPLDADPLARTIAARLRAGGVVAPVVIGHGGPGGVAVAVRHPTRRDRFVLAVETDGDAYASRTSARERERLRTAQLMRLGWNVHRVWSAAWAHDPDGETQRLLAAYEKAVGDADAYDWAVAAAEADVVAGMREEHEQGVATGPQPGETPADGSDATAAPEAEPGDGADGGQDGSIDEDAVEPPWRKGRRPLIVGARSISEYTGRELAAVARWVESDGVLRREDEVSVLLAIELDLPVDDSRTRDVLRHAVRVSRAGSPAL